MNAQAIIVAAGSGTRARGELPKQWQSLLGKPVVAWSVHAFLAHPRIERICLVVAADKLDAARSAFANPRILIAPGGETRSDSVRAGLAAFGESPAPITFVHDAARPGLTSSIIEDLFDGLIDADGDFDCDGLAPSLPVSDALKRSEYEGGLTPIDRSDLYRVQTPQVFQTSILQDALSRDGDFADELEAVEATGVSFDDDDVGPYLKLVTGYERLMKITHPDDFDTVARLIAPPSPSFRTGQGFDVHAFAPGDHVTLCGVRIPHIARLDGHSDADAGWHALTDAILGAACLGDIGDHFPPTDPRWKDADSGLFLRHAIEIADRAGWHLTHADITIICEAPKVKPHRQAMRERTASLTGLPENAVSIKATTTEGLGFTGRREGIAAMATATLTQAAAL